MAFEPDRLGCIDVCFLTVVVSVLKTDFTARQLARVEDARACLLVFVGELVSVVSRSSTPVVTSLRCAHTLVIEFMFIIYCAAKTQYLHWLFIILHFVYWYISKCKNLRVIYSEVFINLRQFKMFRS